MVEESVRQIDEGERGRLVSVACEAWIRRLVDPSRNNTLLFFRHLKVGTLELTEPILTDHLLSGRRAHLSSSAVH